MVDVAIGEPDGDQIVIAVIGVLLKTAVGQGLFYQTVVAIELIACCVAIGIGHTGQIAQRIASVLRSVSQRVSHRRNFSASVVGIRGRLAGFVGARAQSQAVILCLYRGAIGIGDAGRTIANIISNLSLCPVGPGERGNSSIRVIGEGCSAAQGVRHTGDPVGVVIRDSGSVAAPIGQGSGPPGGIVTIVEVHGIGSSISDDHLL